MKANAVELVGSLENIFAEWRTVGGALILLPERPSWSWLSCAANQASLFSSPPLADSMQSC